MFKLIFILFYIIITIVLAVSSEIKINTNLGPIIGRSITVEGKEINEFLGVPYAQPPVKDLRFKKPLPVKSWKEPLNATFWSNVCTQDLDIEHAPIVYFNKTMSEDCLYLNIFTQKIHSEHLKPVMVFIHGGSFITGTGGMATYVPDILVSRGDIIGVTINYRLSTMGFLYTGTKDAPGNMALYDQALALKWVKDNIASFGGNPQQITIFGQSVGSISVSLHVLSPLSRDLYKNAIMMSASSLNHVGGEDPEIAVKTWAKGAKLVGCGNGINFTTEAIECLMKMDPKKLVTIPTRKELINEPISFIPMVVYGDEFLPKKPTKMIENGDFKKNMSLLAGTTDDEGSFILSGYDNKKYGVKPTINFTLMGAYEELKRIAESVKPNIKVNSDDVAKTYFMEISPNESEERLRYTIAVATGDFYVICPTMLFAKGVFKNYPQNKVYQYYFTRKPPPDQFYCGKWQGACHAEDLLQWFGYPFKHKQFFNVTLTDDDRKYSANMMNVLINFVKFDHPSPQDGIVWPNYYIVNNKTVAPYYEFSRNPHPNGNFGKNLKNVECDTLWKPCIDN